MLLLGAATLVCSLLGWFTTATAFSVDNDCAEAESLVATDATGLDDSRNEIEERGYNLDLCGYTKEDQDELLPPAELIANYQQKRAQHTEQIDATLSQIMAMLGRA